MVTGTQWIGSERHWFYDSGAWWGLYPVPRVAAVLAMRVRSTTAPRPGTRALLHCAVEIRAIARILIVMVTVSPARCVLAKCAPLPLAPARLICFDEAGVLLYIRCVWGGGVSDECVVVMMC